MRARIRVTMRGLACASTVLGCALLWAAHAAAAEPVGLQLSCDGGTRYGAAMLLEDPRPGQRGGLWVVTALHVLRGCREITIARVTCRDRPAPIGPPFGARHPLELLLLRERDLAVLIVPESERAAFLQAGAVPLRLRARAAAPPKWRAVLELRARAELNVCPRIPATRRDVVTALDLYESSSEADYYALFGTLAGDTQLVSYESTAVRGTSGGPVVFAPRDPNELIAVHLGGVPDGLQWGVLLERDMLLRELADEGPRAHARLDAQHPTLDVGEFAEPAQLTTDDAEAMAKLDVGLHRDALQVALETSTPIDPFGAYAIAPQLAWSHLWLSTGPMLLDSALGTRIALGGSFGKYRGIMSGPGFEEKPRKGTARIPFAGAFVEVDAELHLARLAPVHYVLGVGVRAGPVRQRDLEARATTFVIGPAVSGQVKWSWLERVSLFAQLRVSVDRIPVGACARFCEQPPVARGTILDAWAGVSMGVEVRP